MGIHHLLHYGDVVVYTGNGQEYVELPNEFVIAAPPPLEATEYVPFIDIGPTWVWGLVGYLFIALSLALVF